MLSSVYVACAFAALAGAAFATQVTIRNDLPRLDVTGAIMDAHDCSVRVLPDGTYVMHAIEVRRAAMRH